MTSKEYSAEKKLSYRQQATAVRSITQIVVSMSANHHPLNTGDFVENPTHLLFSFAHHYKSIDENYFSDHDHIIALVWVVIYSFISE